MGQIELLQWAATIGGSVAAMGSGVAAVRYLWRLASNEDVRYAQEAQKQVAVAAAHHAHALPPAHYAPHLHIAPHHSSRNDNNLSTPVETGQATTELPGVVDMAALDFKPSMQRILLGIDAGGGLITVPAGQLCHVAISGYTGGGKSNLLRLLMPQLQAVGAKMMLCDPHYAAVDAGNGDDWRPIAQRLQRPPAYTPAAIDETFSWFIDELDRRIELRRQGQSLGSPLFLALDELPIIAESVKGSIDRLGRLLREGRKVGIFAVGSSQDFLIKTLGGSGAIRDCYRTAFYSGGDIISATKLLDIPQRDIDEGRLGQGISYLRSSATTTPQLVRVPLASNTAVRGLLGDTAPTVTINQDSVPDEAGCPNEETGTPTEPGTPGTKAIQGIPDEALIAELVRRGKSANEIYKIVGGSRGGVLQRVRELKKRSEVVA